MKNTILLALAAGLPLLAAGQEPSLQTAPPVAVRTVPVAGATDVDASLTELQVTYSKPMQDGSWSWSTWGEENYPETTGKPRYLADGRTCVLPVKLQPDKFYAIWLNSEKFGNFRDADGRSAVPYLLSFRTAGPEIAVQTRTLDKLVSEFPPGPDLSTPEGACAAWQRASAAKDAAALAQLSWRPLNPADQAKWYEREQARDPEGLAIYLKAISESKIVAVQVWHEDVANVITFLPFPPGKGAHPYSARFFGRTQGQWKNLGEDRLPDLEAAKGVFLTKKQAIRESFVNPSLPKARSTGTAEATPSQPAFDLTIPNEPSRALLNDDQRLVVAWTDRQFRSFFDARKFDGWPAQERADLEKRALDTLNGPVTREYYQAINTLGALGGTNALPKLRALAFDRADKDNRDRWMAIRALGRLQDRPSVPELIHLVYHGNVNTRWWAQVALVQITGKNFGSDWNAWGKWWNDQQGQPPFKPEIIRWWSGQAENDRLADSLAQNDQKFLGDLRGRQK